MKACLFGIVTSEGDSDMPHTCTHTQWDEVEQSLPWCVLCKRLLLPASSACLTAAGVQRRSITWCVSVKYIASFRCICGESALKSCTTGMTVISGSYLSLYSLENSDVGLTKHYLILKGLEACIDLTSFECFNSFDPEEIQDFLKFIVFIKGTQFFSDFLVIV